MTSRIAERTGITTDAVKLVLDEYAEQIMRALAKGEAYHQRGFGLFTPVKRAEKLCRNIRKGTAMVSPACYVPKFKPAPGFVELVKQYNSVEEGK